MKKCLVIKTYGANETTLSTFTHAGTIYSLSLTFNVNTLWAVEGKNRVHETAFADL